jgi:RND family efflux transporter MFP subunit
MAIRPRCGYAEASREEHPAVVRAGAPGVKPIRRLALAAVVAALLAGVYLLGRRFILSSSDTAHLRVAGMIEADEVNLTSRIAGRIVALDLREGDPVTKEQIVCRIDSTDVSNELAKARADLAQARADLDNAERMLVRARQVFADKVISVEERDAAATKEAMARAAVGSAEAQVGYYEDQVRDTAIRSPIDGVVVYQALRVGEWVTPGKTILTVDDLSTVWARVDVQETEIAALRVGDPARVTLPGKPAVDLPGRIMAISPEGEFAAERDVRRGRQDIRTFFVKVRVEGDTAAAKPGMTAEVTFDVGGGGDAATHGG